MKRFLFALGATIVAVCVLSVSFPSVAEALTDVFFAGRGIRTSKLNPDGGTCSGTTYDCMWFDSQNRQRFYPGGLDNGKSLYTVTCNNPPPAGRAVLVTDTADGGCKWISPTDGGLVLP